MLRDRGVNGTLAYMKRLLDLGYDYILIDEITTNPRWADWTLESRRFRRVLRRLPRRKVIAYVSYDLTVHAGGECALKARKKLLTALYRRGRALAAEGYLHTREVMAGAAPRAFRTAARRLGRTVYGINSRTIRVLGITVRSSLAYTQIPEYQYLDVPSQDLRSIKRQVNAIRHGTHRLRIQRGIGYCFVNPDDLRPEPWAPYTADDLVARMHGQSLRFRRR